MSNPVFKWFEIEIEIHESIFKPGTDAILFGIWTSQLEITPKTILDAGTGSGILALMMARRFADAQVDAVDVSADVIATAKRQFQNSLWKDRLRAMEADIQAAPIGLPLYDLSICNPPFFFGQLASPDEMKSRSKHSNDTVFHWASSLCNMTKEDGVISVVIPNEDAFLWIREFNANGWYVSRRMNVYTTSSAIAPKRCMLALSKRIQTPLNEEVCLADENQNPDAIFKTWFDRGEK